MRGCLLRVLAFLLAETVGAKISEQKTEPHAEMIRRGSSRFFVPYR